VQVCIRICLGFSVLSEEIGWEERLQNDLFCVNWNIKSQLSQSTLQNALFTDISQHPSTTITYYVKVICI